VKEGSGSWFLYLFIFALLSGSLIIARSYFNGKRELRRKSGAISALNGEVSGLNRELSSRRSERLSDKSSELVSVALTKEILELNKELDIANQSKEEIRDEVRRLKKEKFIEETVPTSVFTKRAKHKKEFQGVV